MLFGFSGSIQVNVMYCVLLLSLREALIACTGKGSNNTQGEREKERWRDNVVKEELSMYFIMLLRTLYIETYKTFKCVSYKIRCNLCNILLCVTSPIDIYVIS